MFKIPEHFQNYSTYETLDILDSPFTEIFSPKDEIILELTSTEVFHGQVIEAGKNRIDITNITQLDTGNKLSGTYSYYRNEIARVMQMQEAKKLHVPQVESKKIKVDKDEYYRLKEMTKNYIFFKEPCLLNDMYADAIKSLEEVEQIGVAALGILKRDAVIPLLALSSWKDIYIFETSNLVSAQFLPKIKELFESEHICKVIHRGGPLLDILHRYYNVHISNVFDTEVVDLMIQKHEHPDKEIFESRTLFQCLEAYLHFPSTLKEKFDVKLKNWTKRPLKESKLDFASQQVAYLITLKEHLSDILFNDFHKTIDNFCDFYTNITDSFDYSVNFNLKELTPDMQNLIVDISSFSITTS